MYMNKAWNEIQWYDKEDSLENQIDIFYLWSGKCFLLIFDIFSFFPSKNNQVIGSVFTNGPGDQGFNPRLSHTKDS